MLSIIKSIYLQGLKGIEVEVQVDVSNGIPKYTIVGLPDESLRESKERVLTAIKNSNLNLLNKKIIINLSPANTRKSGSNFDLAIAIGILFSSGLINSDLARKISGTAFIGELSLDGRLKHIAGVLPLCSEAKRLGIKRIIVPKVNLKETIFIKEIEIRGADSLNEVVAFIRGTSTLDKQSIINFPKKRIVYNIDYSNVYGQEFAKRAVEIAVSGGHNILLIGEPGSGKTMLAKRVCTIMPEPTLSEMMEITTIHSLAGKLDERQPLILSRPFRNPNHGATLANMIGGGINIKPGEFSLANHGVLFLDEFAEFKKEIIEALREPLENGEISINRFNTNISFPAKFMLVATANPCPCGNYRI